MVGLDVELISCLTGAGVTVISLVGGKMYGATPRLGGGAAPHLGVTPGPDDQPGVPPLRSHHVEWSDVVELAH